MYASLFGDLPEASNSKSKSDPLKTSTTSDDQEKDTRSRRQDEQSIVAAAAAAKLPEGPTTAEKLKPTESIPFVPTVARRRNNKQISTCSNSIRPSQSVGSHIDLAKTNLTSAPTIVTYSKSDSAKDTQDFYSVAGMESEESQENEELESLRDLHQSVKDPYDPMVPNDLLQYRERKAAAVERERLEQQRQDTLKEQERLRRRLEEERRLLEQTGDLRKIVEHREQRNMGRGRGVSNLPAWVIAQQRKEEEIANKKQKTEEE